MNATNPMFKFFKNAAGHYADACVLRTKLTPKRTEKLKKDIEKWLEVQGRRPFLVYAETDKEYVLALALILFTEEHFDFSVITEIMINETEIDDGSTMSDLH